MYIYPRSFHARNCFWWGLLFLLASIVPCAFAARRHVVRDGRDPVFVLGWWLQRVTPDERTCTRAVRTCVCVFATSERTLKAARKPTRSGGRAAFALHTNLRRFWSQAILCPNTPEQQRTCLHPTRVRGYIVDGSRHDSLCVVVVLRQVKGIILQSSDSGSPIDYITAPGRGRRGQG